MKTQSRVRSEASTLYTSDEQADVEDALTPHHQLDLTSQKISFRAIDTVSSSGA